MRSTRPLWESSQRPSVNGAAALSSAGMPGVAERTAATTDPARSTGATEANDASLHSGREERQRTGCSRSGAAGSWKPTPHPSAFMVPCDWRRGA